MSKRRLYNQCVITYDTETTNLYRFDGMQEWTTFRYPAIIGGKKYTPVLDDVAGCTYAHMFCVGGQFFMCRTFSDARKIFENIAEGDPERWKIVWVHNLKYDFAASLLNIFDDLEVFARQNRDVIFARSESLKIEFRCSLQMLGTSLRVAAKQYGTETQKGEMNYAPLRGECTPLTDEEIDYCKGDVESLYQIICKVKEQWKRLERIPFTHTGFTRKQVKKKCGINLYKNTANAIPQDPMKWRLQNDAFFGGYVHANAAKVLERNGKGSDNYIRRVKEWDLASAYPAYMLFGDYPMGDMIEVFPSRFPDIRSDKTKLFIGRFVFENFSAKGFNSYISVSRCKNPPETRKDYIIDNGRVRYADMIDLVLTSVDYEIVCNNYDFTNCFCVELQYAPKRPINNDLRRFIVELYKKKTELKGIPELKEEYDAIKPVINGLFGMAVTNTIRNEVIWNVKEKCWETPRELTLEEISEKLIKQKERKKTPLPYSTGAFIPAYVRRVIWDIVAKIDCDVVYCDTDSIKHVGDYTALFDKYNKWVLRKHREVAKDLKIPIDWLSPKDIHGNPHPIGVFEFEGESPLFATCGAKRYAHYDEKGNCIFTIAGVKKNTIPTIKDFTKDGYLGKRKAEKR